MVLEERRGREVPKPDFWIEEAFFDDERRVMVWA